MMRISTRRSFLQQGEICFSTLERIRRQINGVALGLSERGSSWHPDEDTHTHRGNVTASPERDASGDAGLSLSVCVCVCVCVCVWRGGGGGWMQGLGV